MLQLEAKKDRGIKFNNKHFKTFGDFAALVKSFLTLKTSGTN